MTLSIYRPSRLADTLTRPLRLADAMNRLFDDAWTRPFGLDEATFALPIDVMAKDDEFVLAASIPGLKPEEISVEVLGTTVTIRGEWQAPQLEKDAQWMLQERAFGKFSRTLNFPVELDGAKAEANVEHGLLTLRLPKAETAKPKSIRIKAR